MKFVDFINEMRKNGTGYVLLRHDNFMTEVPKLLGAGTPPIFEGAVEYEIVHDAKRTWPIYRFRKREATLMALSYSHEMC